jgi:hypothetical protein
VSKLAKPGKKKSGKPFYLEVYGFLKDLFVEVFPEYTETKKDSFF